MKRLAVGYLMMIFLLTSCFQEQPITIGFSAALSGENTSFGNSLRNGFLLRVDEINAEGGINGRLIEVIVKDDQNELSGVREVDEFFIDKGVDIIFGHDFSFKAETILETTKDKNIIVFSATMATNNIAGIDDNFFRTSPTSDLQGKKIGEYANERYSGGLIIADESNKVLAENIINGYEQEFNGDIEVLWISDSIEADIEKISIELKDYDMDHVFLIMKSKDTIFLSSFLRLENYTTNIFSASWGMSSGNSSEEVYPDGIIFVTDDNYSTPAYKAYVNRYKEAYNEEPGNAAVYAYEGATVLFEALVKAESITYDGIKTSILDLDYVQTVTTRTKFDQYGDALKDMLLYIVKEGELVLLEE